VPPIHPFLAVIGGRLHARLQTSAWSSSGAEDTGLGPAWFRSPC
jgi:hypothetical protein